MTHAINPVSVRARSAVLAGILLVARVAVLSHPVPVIGDDERFAMGVSYASARLGWADPSASAAPRFYPVHHPGYPLWIALGTLMHELRLSTYAALTFWTVVASLIEPVLLYRFASALVPERLAWWLALSFGVGPAYWFLSATALNYVAGSAVGMAVALCAWRGLVGENDAARRWLRIATLLCGIGMGIRPDLLLWYGPLLLWVAWRQGRTVVSDALGRPRPANTMRSSFVRALSVALGLGVAAGIWAGIVSWLYAGGGGESPSLGHTLQKLYGTSVLKLGLFDGFARSAVKLLALDAWALGAAGLLLLIVAVPAVATLRRSSHPALLFLIWWVWPTFMFNLFVHLAEAGYIVWHLPAMYVMLGVGLHRIFGRSGTAVAAASAMLGAAQFWFYPWSAESTGARKVIDAKVAYLSRSGLMQIDQRHRIHEPGDFWRTPAHDLPN